MAFSGRESQVPGIVNVISVILGVGLLMEVGILMV
jgi:hypothetical protein